MIHHYLREGIIPRVESRGLYTDQQVQLLLLVKRFREDHNLSLDIIHRLFTYFTFDPVRLEPLVYTDSLNKRVTRFALDGDLMPTEFYGVAEFLSKTGLTEEQLHHLEQSRLLLPLADGTAKSYTEYDLNIVNLCLQGDRLGIPFDAFGTIGSYVQVAFELEQKLLFSDGDAELREAVEVISSLFVRREIVSSFIHTFLQSLIASRFRERFTVQKTKRKALDEIVYRPSSLFIKKFGLDKELVRLREPFARHPDDRQIWLEYHHTLTHCGKYSEALFFIEQALKRWPDEPELLKSYGLLLGLTGHCQRADEVLIAVERTSSLGAREQIICALCLYVIALSEGKAEAHLRYGRLIQERVTEALNRAAGLSPLLLQEVRLFAGWLLSALPQTLHQEENGITLLVETLNELTSMSVNHRYLPGYRERLMVNAAYLLFECLQRIKPGKVHPHTAEKLPSSADLASLILHHDPACFFAETVFLASLQG